MANSATQYLAVGQTATENFTVTVDDGHGGTVDQIVTVTVTGTNDAPTITAADDERRGDRRRNDADDLTDTGTITFDDIDLIDVHTTSVVPAAGNTLGGTLTAVVTDAGDRRRRRHRDLDLQRGQQRHQYLAVGQTATESFTVTVDDGHGGTVDQS